MGRLLHGLGDFADFSPNLLGFSCEEEERGRRGCLELYAYCCTLLLLELGRERGWGWLGLGDFADFSPDLLGFSREEEERGP
ncbi:hypothetical protein H5410_052577 [Solanum commersonii]|uniref:Uncharacterized protein n=1 Tax=Solanum commersonii TaxID=4109 RepID=A0A9J5X403_SOLCO|nr:hypothetical protein H5410_052577 [Solanum commersonii]